MLLWTVLLFIVDKSGWCYCGLCCCLLWISQAGAIVGCVAVYCGYIRLVLLWAVWLFIVDKSGWCYCGLCCCLLLISQAGVIVGCVVVYSG